MKITTEKSLSEFEFWGQARDFAEKLTESELDTMEAILSDCYDGEIDEVKLNDIFAYDSDWVCEMLGTTWEEVDSRE